MFAFIGTYKLPLGYEDTHSAGYDLSDDGEFAQMNADFNNKLFEEFKHKWTEADEKFLQDSIKSLNDMCDAACLPRIEDSVGDQWENWKTKRRLEILYEKARETNSGNL